MARRRTPPRRQQPPKLSSVLRRVETGPGGYAYEVRTVVAARALKIYRCPGCDHEIRSGTAHLVVWPTDSPQAGVDERRHWHTPCWASRARRGPTRKWS
ncbi:hypothetical protein [Mycobacterium shigaense]|uniref:hypothetical protein n=1 Tax=Mycobacterium shigaense TaxID=722731 RepID=UPI000BBAE31C|nr:hypothetical protein [Mycobacterium shigaense]MEA1121118.1 hypothetical protein [Mycobacterium shigaense]PRI14533.1 hypothetical protein B2J96_14385 [Mycobacterium shigaense]